MVKSNVIAIHFTLGRTCLVLLMWSAGLLRAAEAQNVSMYNQQVPDEQRLYRDLMTGYESSTRPVLNASSTVLIDFELTLHQITDLDERTQVLTTNVFIDQTWEDENLRWDPADYNNIRNLRIPEQAVWLPDTFLFNNADESSTGFMRGMYVLVDHNGTVLWRVPLKLKSSCKVDIAYFPFDDQKCTWQFGSWIYSGPWIDFRSSIQNVHLKEFMDNSEWDLLSLHFEKHMRKHPSSLEEHPDLLFTLHIRRRTLYYLFNIIAPCVMLSVLTLLTFWLPNTSGEKISLGLSVFLAFSMFMLLIAEEVPATSESVPLIGIYLTTVMTMTSVSVIMAVMVINLYNRGSKAVHAPVWLRMFVLEGLSRLLCLKHDIDKMTKSIKLDKEEEEKYSCLAHPSNTSHMSTTLYDVTTENNVHTQQIIEPRPCNGCDSNRLLEDLQRQENLYNQMRQHEIQLERLRSTNRDGEKKGEDVRSANRRDGEEGEVGYAACNGGAIMGSSAASSYYDHAETVLQANGTHYYEPNAVLNEQAINKKIRPRFKSNNKPLSKDSATAAASENDYLLMSDLDTRENEKMTNKYKQIPIPDITITSETSNDSRSDDESGSSSPIWIKRNSVIIREKQERERQEQKLQKQLEFEQNHNKSVTVKDNEQILNCKNLSNVGFAAATKSPNKPVQSQQQSDQTKKTHNSSQLSVSAQSNKTRLQKLEIECPKKAALIERRQIVVEWQTIAAVIDRLLFWVFLIGTLVAYIIILFIMPYTKPNLSQHGDDFSIIRRYRIREETVYM